MSQNSSQREEIPSQTDQVIISEEYPIIEASHQSSVLNRLGKFVHKVGQNQWISEIDLFSIPMKLNYNGEQTYKTEFGGLMFLLVAFISIFFTVIYKFPDGLALNSPINFYKLNEQPSVPFSVFEHFDTFLEVYIYNKKQKRIANSTQAAYYFKKASIYSVTNGVATKLDLSTTGCSIGLVCLKLSEQNKKAYLLTTPKDKTTLNLQVSTCGPMDSSPILGSCATLQSYLKIIVKVNYATPVSGGVQQTNKNILMKTMTNQQLRVDTATFNTNNNFLGHIANALSYDLDFYQPYNIPQLVAYTYLDSTLSCFSYATFSGNSCQALVLISTGITNVYQQKFDDITSSILFFISLMQTFFFLIYIVFIKNYANNALFLRIADSVVFIQDSNGKHYNFKSGPPVFFACLVHNNKITQAIDYILYRFCQTHIKRLMPLKAQLAMKMMDYGQKCLGEEMVFDQMNRAYEQQNLQPTKIIFQENEEQEQSQLTEKEKSLKEDSSDEARPYFDNQIDSEAFKRMCKDHQYYTASRKRHLSNVLKRTDKTYKLALQTQSLFQKYRSQVRSQYCSKEVEMPVGINIQDQSAIYIRKTNQA